jgi:catechol 2,3-dioxygenase-like lactoylglutathione lyase family enzyme
MPSQDSAHTNSTPLEFGHVTPILRVSNIEASLAYYVDALGFALEWRDSQLGSVRRGKASLMLCEGDQGHAGSWVWVAVGDADAAYQELRTRGASIRHPPTNFPWGSRELQVLDPDGNVLRLGSDLLPHEPNGEWLDAEGVRWIPQPGGGWRPAE